MPDAFTDRSYHKIAPVPSTGRPSIYAFRQPARDWYADFFERIAPLPTHGRVLDAGCGPGLWVAATRARLAHDALLVELDINRTRLQTIDRGEASCVTGDVVALPLAAGVFDVVLAMHMLYHVPDIPTAISELRRVLRPGIGTLYAFTNSDHSQREMTELYLHHGGQDEWAMGDGRFSNESGARCCAAPSLTTRSSCANGATASWSSPTSSALSTSSKGSATRSNPACAPTRAGTT